MAIAALVALLLAGHSGWKPETIVRHDGALTVVVSYERSDAFYPSIRNAEVTIIGKPGILVAHELSGLQTGSISVRFQNVWGNPSPEVLIEDAIKGNRTSYELFVGIPDTGRVVKWDFGIQFGDPPWSGERHRGVYEFVTTDARFFCVFTACALSGDEPIQILRVLPNGQRVAHISRSRPDLLRSDARQEWRNYEQGRAWLLRQIRKKQIPPGELTGTLAPYCADEYRLGVDAYCDRVLPAAIKRQLVAWGYR